MRWCGYRVATAGKVRLAKPTFSSRVSGRPCSWLLQGRKRSLLRDPPQPGRIGVDVFFQCHAAGFAVFAVAKDMSAPARPEFRFGFRHLEQEVRARDCIGRENSRTTSTSPVSQASRIMRSIMSAIVFLNSDVLGSLKTVPQSFGIRCAREGSLRWEVGEHDEGSPLRGSEHERGIRTVGVVVASRIPHVLVSEDHSDFFASEFWRRERDRWRGTF